MSKKKDISLDDVKTAKQSFRPTAEEWVDGEAGQRVLERVLAADRSAAARRTPQRRSSRRWAGPRLALVAAAVVLVAAVGCLTAFLVDRGADISDRVVSTQGSVAGETVSRVDAVVGVMPLYKTVSPFDLVDVGSDNAAVVGQAVAIGLIASEEVSGEAGSRNITQGEYAVLIEKAFFGVLPEGSFEAQPVDPRATADERAAVEALMASGIIRGDDGTFEVGKPLTTVVEDRLLTRVEEASGHIAQ